MELHLKTREVRFFRQLRCTVGKGKNKIQVKTKRKEHWTNTPTNTVQIVFASSGIPFDYIYRFFLFFTFTPSIPRILSAVVDVALECIAQENNVGDLIMAKTAPLRFIGCAVIRNFASDYDEKELINSFVNVMWSFQERSQNDGAPMQVLKLEAISNRTSSGDGCLWGSAEPHIPLFIGLDSSCVRRTKSKLA